MTWHNRLAHKAYFVFFSWIAVADLVALFVAGSPSFTYYTTIRLLHPRGELVFIFAAARAIITLLCIIPLFCQAYQRRLPWRRLFVILFFLRLLAECFGRNFEWLFVRSALQDATWLGITAITVYVAFNMPAWLAHYRLAFRKTP